MRDVSVVQKYIYVLQNGRHDIVTFYFIKCLIICGFYICFSSKVKSVSVLKQFICSEIYISNWFYRKKTFLCIN